MLFFIDVFFELWIVLLDNESFSRSSVLFMGQLEDL